MKSFTLQEELNKLTERYGYNNVYVGNMPNKTSLFKIHG